MCRLVQRAILADDEEALERLMPYIKCLNAFILDEKSLLARKTVTHRTSRITKAQADPIQPGDKYRLLRNRDSRSRNALCAVTRAVSLSQLDAVQLVRSTGRHDSPVLNCRTMQDHAGGQGDRSPTQRATAGARLPRASAHLIRCEEMLMQPLVLHAAVRTPSP